MKVRLGVVVEGRVWVVIGGIAITEYLATVNPKILLPVIRLTPVPIGGRVTAAQVHHRPARVQKEQDVWLDGLGVAFGQGFIAAWQDRRFSGRLRQNPSGTKAMTAKAAAITKTRLITLIFDKNFFMGYTPVCGF